MSAVTPLVFAVLLGTLSTACAVDDTAPDGGHLRDAHALPPVPGLSFSPDGLGYCCPIESASCECVGSGGFVAESDVGRCPRICDANPLDWHGSTPDAHGCPNAVIAGTHCCNCPDGGPQAVDAGDDSSTSSLDGSTD